MAADGGVPIVASARAGWDFMRSSLRTIAPAGVLAAAVAALADAVGPGATGAILQLVLELASLALIVTYTAFLFRLAIRQDASGFYGLKAGKDEQNLLGVFLWLGFFFLIVIIFALLIVSVGLVAAAGNAGVRLEDYQSDPDGMREQMVVVLRSAPWLWLLIFAVLAGVIWLSTRLGLASAATIGEGRIMGFSTWSWTKGNVLRIVAATALIVLPMSFALGLVVGIVASIMGVSDLESASAPVRGILSFLGGVGQFVVILPAMNGLLAYLYRGLRPPDLPAR